MQTINLITEVAPKKSSKTSTSSDVKKSTSSFDSALKDCEEKSKPTKDQSTDKNGDITAKSDIAEKDSDSIDENGENNNILGLLGVLAAQMPQAPVAVKTVSLNVTNADVGAVQGVESATDKPETSGDSDTLNIRPIDPGYSKLVITKNAVADQQPMLNENLTDIPVDSKTQETDTLNVSTNVDPTTVLKATNQKAQVSDFGKTLETEVQPQTFEKPQSVTTEVPKEAKAPIEQNSSLDNTEITLVASENVKPQVSDDVKTPINSDVKPIEVKATDEKAIKAEKPEQTLEATPVEENVNTKVVTRKDNFSEQKSDTDSDKNTDDKTFDNTIKATTIGNTSKVARTDSFSKPEKVNVAEQVSEAVSKAVDTGRTEVKIHLNPEELGGISIRIISQNGALSVKISADNRETSQLIASSMSELASTMQDKGLTMEKAEVSYAGNNPLDSSTSQQSNEFSQSYGSNQNSFNNPNNQNPQQNFYGVPKWTVAMDTHGKTATDVVKVTEAKKVQPVKRDDSNMSILA